MIPLPDWVASGISAATLITVGLIYGRISKQLENLENIVSNGHFVRKEEFSQLDRRVANLEDRDK